jgi:ribonuclease BN (tRNA processing enzyme)
MDREHQRNKSNKGQSEKIEFNERGLRREGTVLKDKHIRKGYTNIVQLMNKQHLHSTTTIQLHLTTVDYQRICQDPASEFFQNKRTRIYARGLQQERFLVLLNNSDSRPSNSLFQIARGSGATLSECTFFEKSARHQEDYLKTAVFKQHKIQDPPTFCYK